MLSKKIFACFLCYIIFFSCVSLNGASRQISHGEKERLRRSIKAEANPNSIDISFTLWEIYPREPFEQQFQSIKERAERKKVGSNLTFKPTGFFMGDNYIILCKKRILMDGMVKHRKEITCFFDINEVNISWDKIEIFDNGVLHSINKLDKQIVISNQPLSQRIDIEAFDILSFGKTARYLGGHSTITSLLLNDSNDIPQNSPRLLYNEKTSIGSISYDSISYLGKNLKKLRTLLLDPNDWGICYKVIQYDKDENISDIIEFTDFTKINESNDMYPRQIIQSFFNKHGEVDKKVIRNIEKITISPSSTKDDFSIDTSEFTGYDLVFSAIEK